MSRRHLDHAPRPRREAWQAAEAEFVRRGGSANYLFGTMLDRQTGATTTHYLRERLGIHVPARTDGGARWTRGVDRQTRHDAWVVAKKAGPAMLVRIAARVRAGTWAPDPLLLCRVPKGNGQVRTIAVPTVVDRSVLSVLLEVLEPVIDPALSPAQHGYRTTHLAGTKVEVTRMPGIPRGSCLAVAVRLVEAVSSGYIHLAEADIKKAFLSVNRPVLRRLLVADGCSPRFAQVIIRCLGNKAIDPQKHDNLVRRVGGIPLGNPVGPILFNFAVRGLHELDLGDVVLTSYADNFFLAARTEKDMEDALLAFETRLREDLLLDHAVKQRWTPKATKTFSVLKGKQDGGWRISSDNHGRVQLGPPESSQPRQLSHDGNGVPATPGTMGATHVE